VIAVMAIMLPTTCARGSLLGTPGMNPNLEYSQGVHGVSTGRSYGIIDTLHLVEVARAASILAPEMLTSPEQESLQAWFREYLH